MRDDTPAGLESTGIEQADVLDRLNALEQENQRLQERVESQDERIDTLESENEELRERVKKTEDKTRYLTDDIADLEKEVAEGASSDSKGGVNAGQNPSNLDNLSNLSPLGQIVNLPEHMVDQQLSKNEERARFIAKDIREYADMRLGDLVISSGDIKRVLSAKEEKSIHWQTVGRVIDNLETMGKDDVRVKNRHGTIVCFNTDAVARWEAAAHGVVSGDKGEV